MSPYLKKKKNNKRAKGLMLECTQADVIPRYYVRNTVRLR